MRTCWASREPGLTFHDGFEVVELLMTAYMSACRLPSAGAGYVRAGGGARGMEAMSFNREWTRVDANELATVF